MVCQTCQAQGVSGGQYCSGCGQPFTAQAYVTPAPTLFRARQGKMIAGVCAGVAARWGWDPILVRLAALALVFCGFGCVILAYIAAWIVIPKAPLAFTVPPVAPTSPSGMQAA